MRVVVIKMGFYKGSRRRPGDEFEMLEVDETKKLPKWVQPADMPLAEMPSEEKRAYLAALAQAGPKRKGTDAIRRVTNPFATDSDPGPGPADDSDKLV